MFPLKLISPFKAILRAKPAPHSGTPESVDLSEIQDACDRLTSRLDDAELSRTELMAVAAGLEPIGRQLQQVFKDCRAGGGHSRATRLTEDALQNIYGSLSSIQPFRPYVWPAGLRARLRRTLQSVEYALVALRWADVHAGAPCA